MELANVDTVFLATDATPSEISQLVRALPIVMLPTDDGSTLGALRRAVMDQVVSAHAERFVGNFWSTFSWAIIEMRWNLGRDNTSTRFVHAPVGGELDEA